MNDMTITISGCRPSLVPIDSDLALALNPDQPAVVQLDPPKQLIVTMLAAGGGTPLAITGPMLIFPDAGSPSGYSAITSINAANGTITCSHVVDPHALQLLAAS